MDQRSGGEHSGSGGRRPLSLSAPARLCLVLLFSPFFLSALSFLPLFVPPGNLLNVSDVSAALQGVWCVIHVASPSPTCNNAALFQSVNVGGSRVLLEACLAAGVKRFVYTSSASVVFDGRDQRNFDESAPPPMAAMDDYTKSKLAAEQLVLSFNSDKLHTCAIRPHGIFGARDPHFLPVLAQTGAKGKSKFLIGDGSNLVDFTYVENVAYAHALAAVQLGPDAPVNGQAYFITNREPIFFWEFITRMHRAWGYTLPWLPMPVALMRPLAKVAEAVGSVFNFRPTFTTQAINYSGCAHYYSCARAVREMGYQPPVSMDEAINRSLNYYWDLRNKNAPAVAVKAKNTRKVVTPRPLTAHPLFVPSVLVAVLAVLWGSGCTRTLQLLLLLIGWYVVSSFRASFGAKPAMFPEGKADKLVARRGRNILITGANRGLGYHTAIDILERGYAAADSGAVLLVGCRDASKGEEAIARMKRSYPTARIEALALDLGSFASVRNAVADLKKRGLALSVLIHNAGAMVPTSTTTDGHEAQWQANYLGHFYFTQLLLEQELLAPAARIVNVSSMMHRLVPLLDGGAADAIASDLDFSPAATGHGASALALYCRSKLAQIAWAAKQQRVFNAQANEARMAAFGKPAGSDPRLPLMDRRTIVAVNPGAVATDFIHHFIPVWLARLTEPLLLSLIEKTPAQGVQGISYAALAAEVDNVGGVYMDNCCVCLPSAQARDIDLQERLWNKTLELCPKK